MQRSDSFWDGENFSALFGLFLQHSDGYSDRFLLKKFRFYRPEVNQRCDFRQTAQWVGNELDKG